MAINIDVSAAERDRWLYVYYRGPEIVVTNRYIENAGGRYVVRELHSISRISVDAHHARNMALAFGGIEVVLAAPLAALFGSVLLLVVGFVTALGLVAALFADARRNPRWMALRAVYRGREIT